MVAAVRTTSTLAPTVTQANLTAAIRAAFIAAGFGAAPFDEYTDGSNATHLIYEVISDAVATRGRFYLDVQTTATLAVSHRLLQDWNTAANTFAVGSAFSTAVTFSAASPVFFTGYNHAELKGVILEQGANAIPLMYARPQKPSWWTEETWLFGFIPQSNTFAAYVSVTGTANPYNSASTYNPSSFAAMSTINPITNQRDILPGVVIFAAGATQGVAGRFSADVVHCSATGLTRFDILQVTPGVEEYQLLQAGAAGAIALRVV